MRRRLNSVHGLRRQLAKSLFPPEADEWLGALRIGLGIEVFCYCLSLRRDWAAIFIVDKTGILTRELAEGIVSADSPLIPRLGWVVALGQSAGIKESAVILLVWICLLLAGGCLVAGICCRISAITAWFLHLCAAKSGLFFSYGVDTFTTIGLFYLMIAPLPDTYSFDYRVRTLRMRGTWRLGFHRRVLQMHLCLIYFFGGLTKCLGYGWWTGASLWRALMRQPFNVIPPSVLIAWKFLLPAAGIFVIVLEVGYPLLIWLKATRRLWLVLVIAMHMAIGFAMRMYLFALIMIVLNVASFGPNFFQRGIKQSR
jgi:hypothetical protein